VLYPYLVSLLSLPAGKGASDLLHRDPSTKSKNNPVNPKQATVGEIRLLPSSCTNLIGAFAGAPVGKRQPRINLLCDLL